METLRAPLLVHLDPEHSGRDLCPFHHHESVIARLD
jgi:hypothetical protein